MALTTLDNMSRPRSALVVGVIYKELFDSTNQNIPVFIQEALHQGPDGWQFLYLRLTLPSFPLLEDGTMPFYVAYYIAFETKQNRVDQRLGGGGHVTNLSPFLEGTARK